MALFKELNLNKNIQAALDQLGFTEPTEIQGKAIPILLNQDVDFHGQAQTGTGKTLAFGIPLIHKIDASKNKAQALIVAPTRELVLQICDSLKPILKHSNISIASIYGGVSIMRQIRDLERAQIIVGTPGRLNDHLRRKTLSLKDLQVLVLDEADIMLDMGFKDEIDEILKFSPKNRRIWLFSATVKQGISEIKNSHMSNVVTVRVSQNKVGTQNTKQFYCIASSANRLDALCRIIDSDPEFYGFIFCPTKMLTGEIAERLTSNGYNANCLHGDMEQSSRTRVIQQFRQKKFSILVATDVAARGIDVPDITHVVNYCVPTDHESYVHRIGRTGRAGKTGTAITFINNSELRKMKILGTKFNVEIKPMNIPSGDDLIKVQILRLQDFLTKNCAQSEQKKYSNDLQEALNSFSAEQIKNVLINLVADKFFKRFENNDNLDRERNGSRQRNSNSVEIEIGLGENDGIDQEDIRKYLINNGKVSQSELTKIKVLRKKSFVLLPSNQVNDIIPLLRNSKLNGKRARISVVEQYI